MRSFSTIPVLSSPEPPVEEQGVQTEILNEVLLQLKSLKDLEIIGISKTENISLDESSLISFL